MPPTLSRDLPRTTDTHLTRDLCPRPPRGARRAVTLAAVVGAGLLGAAAPAGAVPVSPPSLLAQGSRGPDVSLIQHRLHTAVTGRFNRRTRRAVLAFQRRDRLAVDGIVGQQTWDALFHITPPPAPVSAPVASSAGTDTSGYTIPSGVVQCESGGNFSAVNPSSGAGGAYQILPSTWAAYGGQGLPQDASPAEQGRIAAEIYANQGPSAWAC
jgi:peptidoglycan hydrolase-like protein with peptidoglycan-binding domain